MTELTKLANYHHSDKGTTADSKHAFTEIYDQFFRNIRQDAINILEVGVFNGASMRMYYDYFPNAKIIGADIIDKPEYQNDRISCVVFDQSNPNELMDFVDESEILFDIIIDDGSHHMEDQQITLYYLSKVLKSGGIYIVEDLHTSIGENGFPLYGKNLHIMDGHINTTLNFLTKKPLNSIYLTDEQNMELQDEFEEIFIFERDNELIPVAFGGKSITSVLIKKHKV